MRPFAFACLAIAFPTAAQPAPQTDPNLNAVLWMQGSAEYAANATQTYRAASRSLRAALRKTNWTAAFEQTGDFRRLPPAIVLDLDETVLDNSAFQAKLTKQSAAYSEDAWRQWVAEARAESVPGAQRFLHDAVLRGVTPFYITNRVCDAANASDGTVRVLQSLRIPLASPGHLLCRTGASDKSERRRSVATTHRILLVIGDDFNDFTSVPPTVEARARLQRLHEPLWGEKWFLLPNPAYGSWESAVGRSVAEKLKRLRE